jgi:putative acetyltransferase
MKAEVRIRAATSTDGSAIRDLVFDVLREYGLAPDPEGTDADLADVVASYRNGSFDVLEDAEGRIIGTVGLHRTDGHTCELRKMYLAKHARGRGLGRRLLEHAIREARSRGFRRIVLETATVLREAVRLYRRRGFERYEPERLSRRCNEAYALELADDSGT